MDYSGSMSTLYRDGVVQELVERLFPLALEFDDNESLDFYLFHDSYIKLASVNMLNYSNYIRSNVSGSMGWTAYAPVLNAIYQENFFDRKRMGLSVEEKKTVEFPTYVIFITDGSNSDKTETTNLIREMSKKAMFIQFVWIGNSSFPFLEKLDDLTGREIDNCDFFAVKDIEKMSDDDLYSNLLNEFPERLKEVKQRGLVS